MQRDLIKWWVIGDQIAAKVGCSPYYAWLVIKGKRPMSSPKAKLIMRELKRQQRKLAAMAEG